MGYQLLACDNQADLAKKAVNLLIEKFEIQKIKTLLISGGSSLFGIYNQLISTEVNLDNLSLILSDERLSRNYVKDANHYMIKEKLISKYSNDKKPTLIYPDISLTLDKKEIAMQYIKDMANHPNHSLLGVGEDGHIASIFSNNIFDESKEYAPFIFVKKKEELFERISFNFNFLKGIKSKIFIVEGKKKKNILEKLLNKQTNDENIPFFRLINSLDDECDIIYNKEILN